MGGGILPVASYKGEIYILFSRERLVYNCTSDSGMWSDFGGAENIGETQYQTALREGFEETDGILGTKNDIAHLMKNHTICTIYDKTYSIWLIKINYNKQLVSDFNKHFLQVLEKSPKLVETNNGSFEKDKLAWIKLSQLTMFSLEFRPWYKRFISQIIDALNTHILQSTDGPTDRLVLAHVK